jgi:hypothetical protein
VTPARRWDDESIRAELTRFIGEREVWPTADEFVAAGREDLRTAVKRHGGATWWAKQLGVPLRPGQDRSPYGVEDAVEEARELIRRLGYLPGAKTVRSLGYPRLATFMSQDGGVKLFARRYLPL